MMSEDKGFSRLIDTMEKLRSDSGCEWDREQTHSSLKPYLIEEAYEVLDAIERADDEMLVEELGDLLLQVVFHAQIASERGAFDSSDIVNRLTDKLVRRHPHVFAQSSGYSYRQWERIKAEEKGAAHSSPVGRLNQALPSLSLARRTVENAVETNLDELDEDEVSQGIMKSAGEMSRSIESEDIERIEESMGELLMEIAKCAVMNKIDPERRLRLKVEEYMNKLEKAYRHNEGSS